MSINLKIRSYILKNVIVFEDDLKFGDDDNIFKMGFVNSLFAMKLLNYVESEFGIVVDDEELNIENFSSVSRITNLVEQKMSAAK